LEPEPAGHDCVASALASAIERLAERHFDRTLPDAPAGPLPPDAIYRELSFPRGVDAPHRRPYTVVNMVSTVDGKVVVGPPGTTGLIGGPTDHLLMGRLMMAADGELFGAQLIRDDNPAYPRLRDSDRRERDARGLRPDPLWVIVTTTAEFAAGTRALEAGPERLAIFAGNRIAPDQVRQLQDCARLYVCEGEGVDFAFMGRILRDELDVHRLNCLGGPTLNGSLISARAVDELFLTFAPKLHGGRGLATAVEGAPFPAAEMPRLDLLSLHSHNSELYLRYKLPF
jgi:riboflavin biosynthesis pyrimidine reductase